MAEREQTGKSPTDIAENIEQSKENMGRPAAEKDEQDTDAYMSNLGAGTGVDIGPGAAGEMGGAAGTELKPAREDNQDIRNIALDDEIEQDLEYPDSGDLPRTPPDNLDDI